MTMNVAGPHLAALLRALFSEIEGSVILEIAGDQHKIDSVEDATQAIESVDELVALNLLTDAGQAGAFSIAFPDPDAAGDFYERTAGVSPTFALSHEDGRMMFVYALDKVVGAAWFDHHGDYLDAIPVPGTGGWDLTEAGERALAGAAEDLLLHRYDEWTATGFGDETPASDAPTPVEEPELSTLNDMTIIGALASNETLLALPLKMGFGNNRQDKRWNPTPMSFGQFLKFMSNHKVSDNKDGKAFLQGVSIKNERRATAMSDMYLVGLDVDCGKDLIWAKNALAKYGLAYIIYTTYSHMKPETFVLQSSYVKWAKTNAQPLEPDNTAMAKFLNEGKKWEHAIAYTAKVIDRVQEVEGVGYRIQHAPMPKFRIVLPLSKAYTVKDEAPIQADAIKKWKRKLLGLAHLLELPIDEACLDPSRLFYLPTHPAGGEFAIWACDGEPLDFSTVPEWNDKGQDRDVWEDAARSFADGGRDLVYNGFSLKRWAAEVGSDFEMANLLNQNIPERIRHDFGDKVEVECPFDHEHSNPGDIEDRGCFATNGGVSDMAFMWKCQHNSCSGYDRLNFVHQALSNGWITTEHLMDENFRCVTVDEKPKPQFVDLDAVYNEVISAVNGWDKATTTASMIEEALRRVISVGVKRIYVEEIAQKIIDGKFLGATAVRTTVKDLRAEYRDDDAEEKKTNNQLTRGGFNRSNTFVSGGTVGYNELRNKILETVRKYNDENRCIVSYGGKVYFVDRTNDHTGVTLTAATWGRFANLIADHLKIVKSDGNGGFVSIPTPDRILRELCENPELGALPLDGFSQTPFYTKRGNIVTMYGYNVESRYWLNFDADKVGMIPASENPTPEEVKEAIDMLIGADGIWGQFPFDDGHDGAEGGHGSRAHFLAMVLQPFVRPMITGPTPIYLVTKPTPGTGGSLLVQTALMVNSASERAQSQSQTNNEEEQRKTITSAFKSGLSYFWVDNINNKMDSMSMANLATAPVWQDRELGGNSMVSFPNKMLLVWVGNNVKMSAELYRRTLPIRLDAKRDPRKRTFKIKDLNEHIIEHMPALIRACLTLVNAWIAAGKPEFSERTLISFESYARIMGGILEVCGVPGFLSNLHLTQKMADDEGREWSQFIQLWIDKEGLDKPITASEVNSIFSELPEFPSNMGIRFADEERVMTGRVQGAVNGKVSAPFDVMLGERAITVQIKRAIDPKTRMTKYLLSYMMDA